MKHCHKCKQSKDLNEFYKNRSRSDGYAGQCKQCEVISHPRKNPTGKYKGKRQLLRRYYAYRNQCPRRGISFNLSLDDFVSLTSQFCYYCGLKSADKDYVGIDRLDSIKGYILSNCVSCCATCNFMKRRHSKDYFLSHLKQLAKHQGWIIT